MPEIIEINFNSNSTEHELGFQSKCNQFSPGENRNDRLHYSLSSVENLTEMVKLK